IVARDLFRGWQRGQLMPPDHSRTRSGTAGSRGDFYGEARMSTSHGDAEKYASQDTPATPGGASQPMQDGQGLKTGLSTGDFHETLSTLLGEIDMLPAEERERLKSVAEATRRRQDELRETVERLQETLDYLRLNIKYLCFDVEATKRENRYLRKVL